MNRYNYFYSNISISKTFHTFRSATKDQELIKCSFSNSITGELSSGVSRRVRPEPVAKIKYIV